MAAANPRSDVGDAAAALAPSARPLASYTPAQRRLLLALIEAAKRASAAAESAMAADAGQPQSTEACDAPAA